MQITFRHMKRSKALETNIREHAAGLERFCSQIMHCDVMIEENHRRHHQGNLFHVRVDITVPDGEVVACREPPQHQAHEDPYVAVRDAFVAAKRQLQNYRRRRARQVKRHNPNPIGRVTQIEPMLDYGRLVTDDGRDIYFHRNSFINADFDTLDLGMRVQFVEEAGEDGPQASTVKLIP
jgi:ribosome-associated translation inhibitor RaiA/cold shock CspA family protein